MTHNIPLEMINYIFGFCQGSTNQIMKKHIKNINELNIKENTNENLYSILSMNMDFGYIYFDYDSFKNDYYDY